MKDLTRGSVGGRLLAMAAPIAAGMIFQTLYYYVDLYFVAQLGDAAIAGVSAAGNLMMIVLALTQVLGVGAVALIAHAVGRRDQADANLLFSQSLVMAAICGALTLVLGYALARPYVATVGADPATIDAGASYLYWFIPGLALQFAMVVMSSALRGSGVVKPTMVVQVATVLMNVALAPVLIAGWGTGLPLGVAGAGLASTIAIAAGVLMLWFYFVRLEKYVSFQRGQWRPRLSVWKRMLTVGLPSGGEFALMFVYTAVTYWVIRRFGAEAQAGFGIGSRVMQGVFLPAMAIAFAVAPVAGQNFGAGRADRVRETFRSALVMGTCAMLLVMLLCQKHSEALIAFFTQETEVIAVGSTFLELISWNFVASGIVFTCSGMFQALGNTAPSLISSATRILTYAIPVIWLSRQPWARLEHVWYLSVATMVLQTIVSLWLLRGQLRARLKGVSAAPAAA